MDIDSMRERLAAGAAALDKLAVAAVYIFGSRVTGGAHSASDWDIAVLVKNFPFGNYERRWRLKTGLDETLAGMFPGEKIDVSCLNELPIHLKFRVISEGKLVYAADRLAAADFEEKTILAYLDFEPILKMFTEAARQRLAA